MLDKPILTIEDTINMEQFYQLSHQAMIYRLVYDKYLDWNESNNLKMVVSQKAMRLGYDDKLYKATLEETKYFFDTDCLSAFLRVRNENLLIKLYGGKIILLEQVYSELSHPRIPHLKTITDNLKNNGDISIENIEMGTEEYKIYSKLTKI
jgi:hypothetical protein